jgi:hypothetical protein
MCNLFAEARLLSHRSILAASVFITSIAVAFGSTAAGAADLAVKTPEAPAYRWTGYYVGLNLGGVASGTNFSSSVDPGTHLLGADPAVVAASGGGGANDEGMLASGQAGCNWQTGTLVLGLEGDFDYFHSNPNFGNNTNTLSDGVTPFTISQSLTTNYLATIRPRIGIGAVATSPISPAAWPSRASATRRVIPMVPLLPALERLPHPEISWDGLPGQAGNMHSPSIGRFAPNI